MMVTKSRRKQRKFLENAPLHRKQDMVSVHVSKDLRKTLGRRSARVKNGYIVKVMRGEHKGKEAKVVKVKLKERKVALEGITVRKPDGKEKPIFLDPSILMLTSLEAKETKSAARSK